MKTKTQVASTSAMAHGPSKIRASLWWWLAFLTLLIGMRLPSIVQPAGGDQGLYGYSGQRILAGDVMYRDMWDQKPPAIPFLYAGLWRLWPHESLVPLADLGAAVLTAGLLIVIGRRRLTAQVGFAAAALFLVLGDPYLFRLGGVYVRGQCEPFIALAVTASLALLASAGSRRGHLILAGVAFATAFWLKYNAAAYAIPVLLGAWAWNPSDDPGGYLRRCGWVALGFGSIATIILAYFAANNALTDWRLATIDYNLRYSNETYDSPASVLQYLLTFPLQRAGLDMLWFVGGLGALLLIPRVRSKSILVIVGWVAAAVLSIAINGSRSLPNYFVQANPALALAASAGLASAFQYGRLVRLAVVALILLGLWRVGPDAPVLGMKLASLPGVVHNIKYDLDYIRGRLTRSEYLRRFSGEKHDAYEIEQLVRYIRDTTRPTERVFVFGFSGGSVGWKSQRASSSRFFWSMPVISQFAGDRPGYGSAGMFADLREDPPELVALQKEEWRSYDFFMSDEHLRGWLSSGYAFQYETPMFSVWRRKR